MDILVRPNQIQDREVIVRIAADNAFFGEPAERFWKTAVCFTMLFTVTTPITSLNMLS